MREEKEEVEGRLYMKHVFAHDVATSYISVISARMNMSECIFSVPLTAFICIPIIDKAFLRLLPMIPKYLIN